MYFSEDAIADRSRIFFKLRSYSRPIPENLLISFTPMNDQTNNDFIFIIINLINN